MPLFRKRKPKPPREVALWTVAPKLRTLKPKEVLAVGTLVHVEGLDRAFPFITWEGFGSRRRALLEVGDGEGTRYSVPEDRIRVEEGAR